MFPVYYVIFFMHGKLSFMHELCVYTLHFDNCF